MMLQAGVPAARWRPPENFHITLQFYGDVPAEAEEALFAALAQIEVPELNLLLRDLGSFGGKHPFALWAGVQGAGQNDLESLRQLSADCARAGRLAGLELESRKYTPHLTLAYCQNMQDFEAARYFAEIGGYEPISFKTSGFHLYSSHLGKKIASYQVEASFGTEAFDR
jgi:2'-5' RNA ligase